MRIMTVATIGQIHTLLGFEPSSAEQRHAQQHLRGLIEPYTRQADPVALAENAAQTLTHQFSRFFRIRAIVAPGSKNTAIDQISALPNVKEILSESKPPLEEQVMLGMLQEIHKNKSAPLPPKSTENELRAITGSANYYALTSDPANSLENLYPYTVRDPKKIYANKQPLIHVAIECGYNAWLLSLASEAEPGGLTCLDGDNETPLRFAAKKGNVQAVKILLKEGAAPNLASKSGRTALTCAIDQDTEQTEIVAALLTDETIKIHDSTLLVSSAWKLATQRKHTQIIALLLTHKSVVPSKLLIAGEHISAWAMRHQEKAIIHRLIEEKLFDFTQKLAGNNVLYLAAVYDWEDVCDAVLRSAEKDTMMNTRVGLLPLHRAIYYQRLSMVKKLIEAQVDVTAIDFAGASALTWACLANRNTTTGSQILALLLAHPRIESILNVKGLSDRAPLDWCVALNNPRYVALLVADVRVEVSATVEASLLSKNWSDVTAALAQRRIALENKPPLIPQQETPPETPPETALETQLEVLQAATLAAFKNLIAVLEANPTPVMSGHVVALRAQVVIMERAAQERAARRRIPESTSVSDDAMLLLSQRHQPSVSVEATPNLQREIPSLK